MVTPTSAMEVSVWEVRKQTHWFQRVPIALLDNNLTGQNIQTTRTAAENFIQCDNGYLVYANQAFRVVGEDIDTTAASHHEELLPCKFEELLGIYTDFMFDDGPRYSRRACLY